MFCPKIVKKFSQLAICKINPKGPPFQSANIRMEVNFTFATDKGGRISQGYFMSFKSPNERTSSAFCQFKFSAFSALVSNK